MTPKVEALANKGAADSEMIESCPEKGIIVEALRSRFEEGTDAS